MINTSRECACRTRTVPTRESQSQWSGLSPHNPGRRGLLGLTKLRALSSLNLSDNTAVRDIGLENLTRLCSLKHLDLSYTGVLLWLGCLCEHHATHLAPNPLPQCLPG